jgi:hypothetical protein
LRRGDFWYPVPVVQKESSEKWKVRWWRGCKFISGQEGVEAEELSTAELPEIVDSLWLLQAERRKIRVSSLKTILWAWLLNTIFHCSSENGSTCMKIELPRASSLTRLRFPIRKKSTTRRHFNHTEVPYKGCSPRPIVLMNESRAKSYQLGEGFAGCLIGAIAHGNVTLESW